MENKTNQNGKTFVDLISEHPKISAIIFGIIILVILIVLLSGKHIKIGSFEMNGEKKALNNPVSRTDTITKDVHETVISEKELPIHKKTVSSKGNDEIRIKDEKTKIDVKNQPSNINTGDNSGVIGNNNTINNIGELPIIFGKTQKEELIRTVDLAIKKLPKEVEPKIYVEAIMGSNKSFDCAQRIKRFLNDKKYNVGPTVNQVLIKESSNQILVYLEEYGVSVFVDIL